VAHEEQFNPKTQDQFQYWELKLEAFKLTVIENHIPVGQKLKMFAIEWSKIIKDPWAQTIIEKGVNAEFCSIPEQNPQQEFNYSMQDSLVINQEIQEMLLKKAIEICPSKEVGVISPLFVVPKPSSGKRPV
jgi:hypothetical protein